MDFIFFKFNDEGGANQVVESGPIMIRGVPFFVFPWNPTKGISRLEHTTCPLWVKLHNIPLVAFNKEGISRIASVLGVPKQMDARTTNMCDKAWGRPGFAKVLVEVWAVGELKRNLELVIPSLTGEDDVKVTIGVEYMWEPSQCSHCLMFGHKVGSCVKAKMATKIIKKAPVVDEDGFELVQRKQWKPKANRSHVEGDQFNSTNSDSSPTDHQDVGVTTNDRAEIQMESQPQQLDDTLKGVGDEHVEQVVEGVKTGREDNAQPRVSKAPTGDRDSSPHKELPPMVSKVSPVIHNDDRPKHKKHSEVIDKGDNSVITFRRTRRIIKTTNRFISLASDGGYGKEGPTKSGTMGRTERAGSTHIK